MNKNKILKYIFLVILNVLIIGESCRSQDFVENNYKGLFSEKGKIIIASCDSLNNYLPKDLIDTYYDITNSIDALKKELVFISKYNPQDSLYNYLLFKFFREDIFAECYGNPSPEELMRNISSYDSLLHISTDSVMIFSDSIFIDISNSYNQSLGKIYKQFEAFISDSTNIISINISKNGQPIFAIDAQYLSKSYSFDALFFENFIARFGYWGIPTDSIALKGANNYIYIKYYDKMIHVTYPVIVDSKLILQVTIISTY